LCVTELNDAGFAGVERDALAQSGQAVPVAVGMRGGAGLRQASCGRAATGAIAVVETNPARCATASGSAEPLSPASELLPGEFLLRDGTPALIWPLLPTDAEMLREGFRLLSPESRRLRFFTALGELDDAMIRRLVDSVDGVHHIALLLIV